MRHSARRDGNERSIVAALRASGCSVQQLSAPGVPDLLVGKLGVNVLLEVKDPAKAPSARRLTPAQVDWHARWRGQVAIVETVEQALRVVQLCSSNALPF